MLCRKYALQNPFEEQTLIKNSNIVYLGIVTFVIVVLIVAKLLVNPHSDATATDQSKRSQADMASVYQGKTIRFIVPTAPGGGFDEYSRLLAPFLERYTGASVQIVNLPGAGGMRAVNELSNAPRNGLTIAIMNGSGMVTNRLAGIKGADYRSEELEYLGRMVADSRVLSVMVGSGYDTIEDIWGAEESVKLGATGLGASGYLDGVISKQAFDLNVQVIHGFDTFPMVKQSMVRGNIVGAWTSWANVKDAHNSGTEKVLLQSGRVRIKELADVPTVFELIDRTSDPDRTRNILTAWDALNSVGRPVATTPGTPVERVQYLRDAFRQAMQDPDLLLATERANRPIHYASGEEMDEIIRRATEMDEDIEQLFTKAIRGELY